MIMNQESSPLSSAQSQESSELSPAAQTLNQLFEEGAGKGLWEEGNMSDFARAIDVPRRKINGLLRGKRVGESTLSAVLEVARRVIETGQRIERADPPEDPPANTEGIKRESTEFDRYYLMGIEAGLWSSARTCAEALGLGRKIIGKYRITSPDEIRKTPKGKGFFDRIMRKIKSHLRRNGVDIKNAGTGTDSQPSKRGEETGTPTPPGQSETPRKSGDQIDLAALMSHPAIARIDDLEERLTALIQEALAQSGSDTPSVPEGVVPSEWADEVVAGRTEILDQRRDNMRFLVTADTFRKLLAQPLSSEETDDTRSLAEVSANADVELRRRLEILHQMEESPERSEAIKALVPALSERVRQAVALAITINKVRECDVDKGLLRAAKHFDSLSDISGFFKK